MSGLRPTLGVGIAVAILIVGSGCDPRGAFTPFVESKNATEDRDVTPPEYVPGAGIDVQTPVGSVDIVSDPTLKEIKITARISAYGKTDEEAKARLQNVKVKASRRTDSVLEIA